MSLRNYIEKSVQDLVKFKGNSRTHSDGQIEQIVNSIKEFGFTNPLLIDEYNTIIAGHGRLDAALRCGMKEVPCVILKGLTEAQKSALVIADNKIATNAGWDLDILRTQFDYLKDLDYNLELTGFDLDEIQDLFPDPIMEGLCPDDETPALADETISKLGDLWLLGNHRLLCGDSTSQTDVDKLLNENKIDMVFTDPPYGVDAVKDGKVGADFGIAKKGNYAKIIGDETTQTAINSYGLCLALNIKVLCFWGGNYYASQLTDSKCWIIWDKREDTGIKNTFADCEIAWTNQQKPSRIYRQLWNGMIRKGEHEKRVHPTQKPVALAEWCMKELDPDGLSVLDLFGGSGSSLIACEKLNRKCFMMELDPKYCDVIIQRYEKYTGNKAVLENENAEST